MILLKYFINKFNHFSCDICDKGFIKRIHLEIHIAVHKNERPFECKTCGKTFKLQKGLNNHYKSHLPENMKLKYSCDLCDKR